MSVKMRNEKGEVTHEVGFGELCGETAQVGVAVLGAVGLIWGGIYLLAVGGVWVAEKTTNLFSKDSEEEAKKKVDEKLAAERQAASKEGLRVNEINAQQKKDETEASAAKTPSQQDQIDALASEMITLGGDLKKVVTALEGIGKDTVDKASATG